MQFRASELLLPLIHVALVAGVGVVVSVVADVDVAIFVVFVVDNEKEHPGKTKNETNKQKKEI